MLGVVVPRGCGKVNRKTNFGEINELLGITTQIKEFLLQDKKFAFLREASNQRFFRGF